jgi:Na+/proline symporter
MFTGLDKAIQDFIVSGAVLVGIFWPQMNDWQSVVAVVAGAVGKAVITYIIPNKTA